MSSDGKKKDIRLKLNPVAYENLLKMKKEFGMSFSEIVDSALMYNLNRVLLNRLLLDEQNSWTLCAGNPPTSKGRYLVIRKIEGIDDIYEKMDIMRYDYFGKGKNRHLAFYFYDRDMNRIECSNEWITHWTYLPGFEGEMKQ